MTKKKVSKRGGHFSTHGCSVDLKVVVIVKRKIIHGKNHANEVTECASGNVIMRASTQEMVTSINTFVICGILVYKDKTSSVTNNELEGSFPMVRGLLRKSLVSLTKDGNL